MDPQTLQRTQREYLENRIRSAHPIELVNMLYQVAIENLNAAIEHLKTQDRFARSAAVTRAEQAVEELLVSLDHSVNAPVTHNLASLYRYCSKRMVVGHATQTEQPFREALSVLSTLSVAWQKIQDQTCGTPEIVGEMTAEETPAPEAEPVSAPYSRWQQSPETVGARDWSC